MEKEKNKEEEYEYYKPNPFPWYVLPLGLGFILGFMLAPVNQWGMYLLVLAIIMKMKGK